MATEPPKHPRALVAWLHAASKLGYEAPSSLVCVLVAEELAEATVIYEIQLLQPSATVCYIEVQQFLHHCPSDVLCLQGP